MRPAIKLSIIFEHSSGLVCRMKCGPGIVFVSSAA